MSTHNLSVGHGQSGPLSPLRAHVSGVIPKANHRSRLVVLVSQGAEACGIEQEKSSRGGFQTKPSRGHNAQKMPAGEKQYVSMKGANALNDMVGPSTHLLWDFAPRAAVTKQTPAWVHGTNLDAGEAFVLAVIPLK